MNTSTPAQFDLTVVHTLAQLLERLECSSVAVDAEQYRSVVLRLADALRDVRSDAALGALLQRFPASAELYENLNYHVAGLCRSNLDLALAAELKVKTVIERAQRAARPGPHQA